MSLQHRHENKDYTEVRLDFRFKINQTHYFLAIAEILAEENRWRIGLYTNSYTIGIQIHIQFVYKFAYVYELLVVMSVCHVDLSLQ